MVYFTLFPDPNLLLVSFLITLYLWILLPFNLSPPGRYDITGYAQGTSYQISYYADASFVRKDEIDSLFSALDSSLSIYKPYSLINSFNSAQRGVRSDLHLKKVISKALEISEDTKGAFDVTIYPLVDAWGFGATPHFEVPDASAIAAHLSCMRSNKIFILEDSIAKSAPCIKLDVNGIAQGYSVDFIAHYLEGAGIKNYLVEVGGEIRVGGTKQPSGDPFVIGLESPPLKHEGTGSIGKKVALRSGALTTSGNYRRFREQGGKSITPLIDPQTGHPTESDIISVTVMANDAMTADGYDNAFMVMGVEKSLQFLNSREDLEAYFIYKKSNGSIADTASTGFYCFLK